jgi:hypothetical protein
VGPFTAQNVDAYAVSDVNFLIDPRGVKKTLSEIFLWAQFHQKVT